MFRCGCTYFPDLAGLGTGTRRELTVCEQERGGESSTFLTQSLIIPHPVQPGRREGYACTHIHTHTYIPTHISNISILDFELTYYIFSLAHTQTLSPSSVSHMSHTHTELQPLGRGKRGGKLA